MLSENSPLRILRRGSWSFGSVAASPNLFFHVFMPRIPLMLDWNIAARKRIFGSELNAPAIAEIAEILAASSLGMPKDPEYGSSRQ